MRILIKDGTVVNADGISRRDVLIDEERILRVAEKIMDSGDKKIDAKGKYIFPGFIDMHTHLRTPGREDEEDIASGSRAAVKGGFTKILCMPNTEPSLDNETAVKWVIEQAKKEGLLDVYPVGAITIARAGKQLTEFGALKRAGCLCLSDDGNSVADGLLLKGALEYAAMDELLIISHCEDKSLANQGAMREGGISSKYGIAAIPDICESLVVARDIEIAKYLNARIHLAHISTAKSVEIIRRAKQEGVRVTCETCPHYFIFTVDDIEKSKFDTNFKVNPPLGEKDDLERIRQALKEGVIDCIATDHAPHSKAEKEQPFEYAPFGFIGMETAFSAAYTYLVKTGIFDLNMISQKMACNPARILGFEKCASIEEGFESSLVVADLNSKWDVTEENIQSKSKNTPFLGRALDGVIEYTIHKGKIVYSFRK